MYLIVADVPFSTDMMSDYMMSNDHSNQLDSLSSAFVITIARTVAFKIVPFFVASCMLLLCVYVKCSAKKQYRQYRRDIEEGFD